MDIVVVGRTAMLATSSSSSALMMFGSLSRSPYVRFEHLPRPHVAIIETARARTHTKNISLISPPAAMRGPVFALVLRQRVRERAPRRCIVRSSGAMPKSMDTVRLRTRPALSVRSPGTAATAYQLTAASNESCRRRVAGGQRAARCELEVVGHRSISVFQ
jgi:hypothetical protein